VLDTADNAGTLAAAFRNPLRDCMAEAYDAPLTCNPLYFAKNSVRLRTSTKWRAYERDSVHWVPLLADMGCWGLRHTLASKELSVRAKILEDGGPKLWSEFVEELRHLHLEAPAPRGAVLSRPQSAYEAAIAKPLA